LEEKSAVLEGHGTRLIQVDHPLSEMLGTGSVSDFGFFRVLEYLLIIMRQLGDGNQI
jgi:hypothetical protein